MVTVLQGMRRLPFAAALMLAAAPASGVVEPRWQQAFPPSEALRESLTVATAAPGGLLLASSDFSLERVRSGRARLVALDGQGAMRWAAPIGQGATLAILQMVPCGGGVLFLARSDYGNDPTLVAGAASADGSVRWRREVGPIDAYVVVPGGYAMVATEDCSMAVVRAVGRSQAGASVADRSVHVALLAAADGSPRWSRRMRAIGGLEGHAFAPVVAAGDGGIHVVGRRLSDGLGVIVRLAQTDGGLEWVSPPADVAAGFPGSLALASHGGRVVVAGWGGAQAPGGAPTARVAAFAAGNGMLSWVRSLASEEPARSAGVSLDLADAATVRIGDEIARLSLADGEPAWRWSGRAVIAHAVGADGSVAVAFTPTDGEGAHVQRLAPEDGRLVWTRSAGALGRAPVQLAIAADSGNVAMLGAAVRAVLDGTEFADELVLLRREDGGVVRRGALPVPIDESTLGAAPIGADAVVVAGAEIAPDGASALLVERRSLADGVLAWHTRVPLTVPGEGVAGLGQPLVMDGLVAVAVLVGPQAADRVSSQLVVLDAATGAVEFVHQRAATIDGGTFTGWFLWPVAMQRGDGVTLVESSFAYTPPSGGMTRAVTRHLRFAGGGWTDPSAGDGVSSAYATPEGILVTDYLDGPALPLRLLDRIDGRVRWSGAIADGRDWLRGVTVGADTAYFWGDRGVAPPPAADSRLVVAAMALADGELRWRVEHDSLVTIPDTPTEVRLVSGGDLLVSLMHRGRAPGQSVWRMRASDGTVAWRSPIPAVAGWSQWADGLLDLPDGRVAAATRVSVADSPATSRLSASYLVALDPATGASGGWYAVAGAQPHGAGPDRAPWLWASGGAGPWFVGNDWSPAQASSAKLFALAAPPAAPGDVSLEVVDVRRDAPGSGRLDVVVDARYAGALPEVDTVLRIAAPAGALMVSMECVAQPPSACAVGAVQPHGRQALRLASGSSVRVAFSLQALGWPADSDRVHAILEGDYRIADDDPGDAATTWPMATVLLRDSME